MRVTMMRLGRWGALVLTLALLPLGQLVTAAAAHADTPGPTGSGSVCFLGLDGSTTGCAPTKLPSPGLISPHYLGSDETRAAMHRLEDEAVARTLADHGLPASDAEAVRSWGRQDAQAELWSIIVEAIKTPAAQRTPDQQSAVTWITWMDRSLKAWSGRNTGLEYTKWAGLSTKRYWELVNSGAGVSELTDFLHSSIEPYGPGGQDQATTGYCRYKPPAPLQDEYSGSTAQTCYAPCPDAFGCYVPTPSFDQFVRWGSSTVSTATTALPGYVTTSAGITGAAAFGGAMAAAGLQGVGLYGLASVGYLEEFLLIGNLLNMEGIYTLGGEVVAAATQYVPEAVAEAAEVLVSELTSTLGYETLGAFEGVGEGLAALEAGTLGTVIGVVIWATVSSVVEGVRVFDNDSLPSKVAQLVVNSAKVFPDPATIIDTPEGTSTLFNDFVFAALPAPTNNASCQIKPSLTDYRLGLVKDLGEGSFLYYSTDDGRQVERDGYQCLNPTPLPEPRDTDPQFLVEPRARRSGDPAEPTRTASISAMSRNLGVTSTIRLSNSWFVQHLVAGDRTVDQQTLSLGYEDWDGAVQTAWLVQKPDGEYEFVGRAVTGDQSGGTGWASPFLQFVGADGRDYRARVDGFHAPVGSPTYAPRSPVEGSAVRFAASNFGPGGGPVMAPQQSWRFQGDSCGGPCRTVGGPDNPGWAPAYGPAVTGRGVDHTFQAPGTYSVELTVTDPVRGKAVTTFEVVVGGVAPTLDLAAAPGRGQTGTPVWLAGDLTHTGTGDHERVTIDWGDGTPVDSVDAGGTGPWASLNVDTNPVQTHTVSDTQLGVDAHHTYTRPGAWQVTVVATDSAGQTDTQTLVEQIQGPQTIAFSLPTQRRYGDRIPLSATGGGSSQPVTFTTAPDTVCTTDDTNAGDGPVLRLVGPGDCTVTAHQDGDPGDDALYQPAAPVTQSVHVDPAPLRVTVDRVTRVYGSASADYHVRAHGLVGDDTVADLDGLTVTGAPPDAHVGQYQIVASGITDPRYDVTYVPAPEGITPAGLTVTVEDKTRQYGDPAPTYTARFAGLVGGDDASDITGLRFTGAAANARPGSYPIGLVGRPTNPDYAYRVQAGTETVT
ncbi:MAG TPA: MBG domain-containing protein [Nocardioides sp.]|uniref:MBG domain-containing protein n=1 Tax=Nocardioides sp. TaxID=35761 RepID=UPI002E32D8E4|nr:MBG domain-containing protein [Nocardioides sp.]HEX3929790.1 MBG domain-containing protein [Nocardioides sp.]